VIWAVFSSVWKPLAGSDPVGHGRKPLMESSSIRPENSGLLNKKIRGMRVEYPQKHLSHKRDFQILIVASSMPLVFLR